MTAEQLHILQHSLGLDEYGHGHAYRNHYVCDSGNPDIDTLVGTGLMADRGTGELFGGGAAHCYTVTPAGEAAVRSQSPNPPKLSKSAQRYREFLNEDSGMRFGEWLHERHGKQEVSP